MLYLKSFYFRFTKCLFGIDIDKVFHIPDLSLIG